MASVASPARAPLGSSASAVNAMDSGLLTPTRSILLHAKDASDRKACKLVVEFAELPAAGECAKKAARTPSGAGGDKENGSIDSGAATTPSSATRTCGGSAFTESGPGCEFCERKNEAMAKMRASLKAMKAANRDLTQTAQELVHITESLKAMKQAERSAATPKSEPPMPTAVTLTVASHKVVADSHVEYDVRVEYGRGSGHVRPARFLEVRALHQRLLTAAEADARATWTAPADPQHVLTLERLRRATLPGWGVRSNARRFEAAFIQRRTEELQRYFDEVVVAVRRAGRGSSARRVMVDFLELDRHDESVWRDDRLAPLSASPTRASRLAVREGADALADML